MADLLLVLACIYVPSVLATVVGGLLYLEHRDPPRVLQWIALPTIALIVVVLLFWTWGWRRKDAPSR